MGKIIKEGSVFQREEHMEGNLWKLKKYRRFEIPEAYDSRWAY